MAWGKKKLWGYESLSRRLWISASNSDYGGIVNGHLASPQVLARSYVVVCTLRKFSMENSGRLSCAVRQPNNSDFKYKLLRLSLGPSEHEPNTSLSSENPKGNPTGISGSQPSAQCHASLTTQTSTAPHPRKRASAAVSGVA
ncbi:hypothetical protein PGT21_004147 [Puccinia graminis f. sp. tritici]|uniref:Uncharacterized protein n=1 Tax=Puccinia graminis f. sp. tritici TaxID=56615 RepID=A0A5B0MMW4_PUCGR|nr:hypothetical protein PGT21_004147 [Puccinia graminis f. sp. tritici]